MFGFPRPQGRPIHCRDERIGKTQEKLCTKRARSVAELMADECKNCGRPFVDQGEWKPEEGAGQ